MTSNVNMYGNWWRHFIAENILSKKYYHDEELDLFNNNKKDEAFDAFVNRICSIFSTDELKDFMKKSLYNGDYILAGRSLYAAGAKGKFKSSLSNCYILPTPKDNIESIFDTAKEMARIFSYGGGCGIDLSELRPNHSKVNNVAKSSSGAVSFMNVFNVVGEVIAQNNRRGALLIAMNCTHPDIEEFLDVKKNNDKIQMANISIKFTTEFMQAVQKRQDFQLRFTTEIGEEITKTINAAEFFHKFAEAQWDYAEPGAIFIDRVKNWNILAGYPENEYKIDVSNPCSEFFSNAYNSCNLSSINLYNFVDRPYSAEAKFDFNRFAYVVQMAVQVANEVLDYGYDTQPLKENRKCIDDWRSIGIGIFGLADMLIALGIRYGSEQSILISQQIMNTMQYHAMKASIMYAKEHGSFKKFDFSKIKKSPYMQEMFRGKYCDLYDLMETYGLANGTLLSVAPTGSIAMLFRESGGIEPYYRIAYERTTHQLEKENKKFSISMLGVDNLVAKKGIVKDIKAVYDYIVDTYDIEPLERIKIQAAIQKYVDNAISSTINLPESATVENIEKLYITAWQAGCKGITIFRDNCKRINILGKDHGKTRDGKSDTMIQEGQSNDVVEDKEHTTNAVQLNSIMPIKRGKHTKSLWGRTFIYSTACVPKFYVTVNLKEGEIFEVFVGADKGCQANISTITRLTSLALRAGIKVEEIVKNLNSAICPACQNLKQKGNTEINKSCASCIASAIIEMQKTLNGGKNQVAKSEIQAVTHEKSAIEIKEMMKCPECGEHTLIPDGKCAYCQNCGFSKCD